MEDRDLIIESSHNFPHVKQERGFFNNRQFIPNQNHDLGLASPLPLEENDLGLGVQQHDHNGHDLGLSHDQTHHHLTISQIDEENMSPLQLVTRDYDDQGDGYSHENEAESNVGSGSTEQVVDKQNFEDPDHDHDHQLGVTDENHHKLDVSDSHDFDGNMELTDGVSNSEFEVDVPELIYPGPPIVQSRCLVPVPDHELHVGQEFPDVQSCRRALRNSAIALHFEIQTVKSDKTRFTAKCVNEGCPWRIHAAKLPGVPTFSIRTLNNNHTCQGLTHLGHQQATVEWVAHSVEQQLMENPNCKPKEILEEIHRVHGIALSYKQAWRGKERIMATLRGSFEEGYKLLPQYVEQIERTNPGSIAAVYANPEDNCFHRLFVSFQASIYGFLNGCRPLLGLDRITLKSKYLGNLLLAAGYDGDGALFPLAFGVIDEESDDNWMWFLSELHSLLEMNTENMPRLTILSDRQKGIVDGVEANFPTAFHGFCMRHLSESFRKEFNNTMLVNLFWEAARALTVIGYETKVLEIEEISSDAAYWIRRLPPRLWATSYFEGTRFGHLTASMAESVSPWILEASTLPMVQMMENIRRQLMTWFNERRELSMQWTSTLVPNAERQVAEAIEQARSYQVLRANEAEFEVISHEGTNIVDIRNRCCLCHGWQAYGLPCAHAVAALLSCRQNVHRFTESCFTVATYRKAYSQTIHPIPDKTLWNEGNTNTGNLAAIVLNPPKSLRPPPRPRKKRVRAEDRGALVVKRVVHCSRCNQTGHFRTTCAAPI
ncbi:hypothetical protein SOVF_044030 [Spinacia oleracea]|uniref:Uncharacterized protein LOC110784031 n=1 Tax=Spinacia oleracea TaxID=3562 RepID=A0A9R0JR80_SPIOL|nr:uncharacterized protein LOC110784031 [Spinacia oleracea]XP_021844135.1 uncharacterized protein LOC110784031 [Spinacia oleracea]KNA21318.1 hypothetical protein SOVF_044030 [Spinacia oleracea]